jgi:hyperosmotically inducible protein
LFRSTLHGSRQWPPKEARVFKQKSHFRISLMAVVAALSLTVVLSACNRHSEHPDYKDAVNTAMTRNNLGVVNVSQDRQNGVITLTGDVESDDQKHQAGQVAVVAAPGYQIANELAVRPIGQESQAKDVQSNLDDGIESNFKASLKAHKDLDTQHISYDAKNGTLVLKGKVKSQTQKTEAQKLAQAVPNVKQVVNEIEIR